MRPWFWQDADVACEAITTAVNTRWATGTNSCDCLVSPAVPLLLAVAGCKAHPTSCCFSAGIFKAFLQCFLCCSGQEGCSTSEQDRCSLSFSQLLPKLKLSSLETALASQKGSGERRENFHSSLQPPVLPWAFSI